MKWLSQKIGMIGPPGIGKSEFWSHGEHTLYLQTEAGLNHLSVYKVPIREWGEFSEVFAQLKTRKDQGTLGFDCIIWDTIDKTVDLANQESISRGRAKFKAIDINTVGDIPNGAGWTWATELIENMFAKFETLGVCLVYIGHLESREIKSPTSSYHKLASSIGGKTGGFLLSWPDHLLNIEASMQGENLRRRVRTLPMQTMDAKSRGGYVPDGMEWSKNSKDNYTRFRSLFQ